MSPERFPALFSLEGGIQPIPLEAFYSRLGLHVDTLLTRYLCYRYLKTDIYVDRISPSSLWKRLLLVVVVVIVSGSRWVGSMVHG